MNRIFSTLVVAGCLLGTASALVAQEKAADSKKAESKGKKLELGRGAFTVTTPGTWKQEKPRSGILQYEFSAPADAKEDEPKARITIMNAGGSIDQNIQRWIGQFTQPDDKATKDVAKVEKFEASGQTVHWVDITGTFKESMGGGPFAPGKTVMRKDHRMIGVIVVSKKGGQCFIKMTGPNGTVEKLAKDFNKMLKDLKAK